MSYVVVNAITVPAAHADELAARFAGRAGMVESADGFERFELLRPADDRERWLVVTTWRDRPSFEAWMASTAFGRAHGGAEGPPGGHTAPVATTSEVWAFTVEQQAVAGS